MGQSEGLPVLPKATAVWLVENSGLTFKQIGDFCGMHELEVKGIADGDVCQGIMGVDPVASGQLTFAEIDRCMADANASLQRIKSVAYDLIAKQQNKKAKYTPVARRQDKPDAIQWLLKNYPSIEDRQIIKLLGTTKSTILAIRDKSHWNMKNIRPRDPVLLGICTQTELDKTVLSLEPADS